jgi:hypothetical protein
MSEEFIEELRRIRVAMEKSASALKVSKQPDLWDYQDIASWLKLDHAVVRDRVCKEPTFPLAFSPTQSKQGHKVYFASDVIEWARINLGKYKHLQWETAA